MATSRPKPRRTRPAVGFECAPGRDAAGDAGSPERSEHRAIGVGAGEPPLGFERQEESQLRVVGSRRCCAADERGDLGCFGCLDRHRGLRFGPPTLANRHGSSDQSKDQCRADTGHESAQATDAAAFAGSITLRLLGGRQQVAAFGRGEPNGRAVGPAVVRAELRSLQQEVGVVPVVGPVLGRCVQPPLEPDVAASVGDPAAQPRPLLDECLVGGLDGGASRHRVAIEAQEPRATERVQYSIDVVAILPVQLVDGCSSTGVGTGLVQCHQVHEDLAAELLVRHREIGVEMLGSATQRSRHATETTVGLDAHRRAVPLLEQFRQRVLEEWQRRRLPGHVRLDVGGETRLEVHACGRSGSRDRPLQFLLAHRCDQDGSGFEEAARTSDAEGGGRRSRPEV